MSEIDPEVHARIKSALLTYVPWDLRERLDGPLDAMATIAYVVVTEIKNEDRDPQE